MEIQDINELLKFVPTDYRVKSLLIKSGQRHVYMAEKNGCNENYVLKTCPLFPTSVARIQRELKILSEVDSAYFPKSFFQSYITDEVINYFIDNFNPKEDGEKIEYFRNLNIKPFLVTVEEYIPHQKWPDCLTHLSNFKNLVRFLQHIFHALQILTDKKIVHRDLKPDNILIKYDFTPVIIDLGIAKSMTEGTVALTLPNFPSPCTPQFAAPEQLSDNKTEVTYKSDQFAIGTIIYLLLTNKFPYGCVQEIGVEGVIQNLSSGKMESVNFYNKNVPEGLSLLVEKMLQIQPYKRYRHGADIIEQLNKLEESL